MAWQKISSTFLFIFLMIWASGFMPVLAKDGSSSMLPDGFDVEGHRGARGLKPENTLPAFETALDLGVTTLEVDLHFTQDQVVVLWHDDNIPAQKCGLDPDSQVDVPDPDALAAGDQAIMISALTFEQIHAFRCDRNPDPAAFPDQNNDPTTLAGDDYRITSLEALFIFVETYAQSEEKTEQQRENAASVQFNIETKRTTVNPKATNDNSGGRKPGAFELAILNLVEAYNLEDRVIIQSFDHRSLWIVRAQNDSIRLAALTARMLPDLADLAEQGATIWSCDFNDLTPDLLNEAHEQGLLVIPWTINDPDIMREFIEMGVDGIITDRPDILLNLETAG